MNMKLLATSLFLLLLATVTSAQNIDPLRGSPINTEQQPEKMSRVENRDMKRARAYPMQPPTIPHKTDGYQLDLNVNKCMSCHSRRRSEASQAPMISVTHYQDRDGNFLADVSPRRYFCEQCHMTQDEVTPPVKNLFVDIDELLRTEQR